MSLIEEINKLRVELRNTRHRVRDLETTMGINRKQGNRAREILERITGHRPNPVVVAELTQANRTLHEQSHFMHLLQERLRLGSQFCLENTSNATGHNLPPLPPIQSSKECEGEEERPATDPRLAATECLATPRAKSVM